jgi:hypothetical protein
MEPIIIVYTREEAKRAYERFDNFVAASFYIGTEHRGPGRDSNVKLVKVEMYSADDPEGLYDLKTFIGLLVDRGIDHETKFFPEPSPSAETAEPVEPPQPADEEPPSEPKSAHPKGYDAEMRKLKEMRNRGTLSKKEYKAQREELLEKWRKEVDEHLKQ